MDKKLHKSLLIYVCTIIFIFVSILAFGLNSVVTFAQEARKEQKIVQSIHAYEDISKNERLYQLAEKHVEFKMDSSLEIESVKSIIDFDGNNYVVFEMTPIG